MIVPGIFEKDFEQVKNNLQKIQDTAKLVQIDIADGVLVDGKTFLDPQKLNALEIPETLDLELHLMVTNPQDYVVKINNLKTIYTQIEAFERSESTFEEFLQKTKDLGYQVGLSVNPETSLETLEKYIEHADFVQFMTVVPGAQGRPLQTQVLDKIKQFKAKHPNIPVQIDGGLNKGTIEQLVQTGIDSAEAGSAIFAQKDAKKAYLELEKLFFTMRVKHSREKKEILD